MKITPLGAARCGQSGRLRLSDQATPTLQRLMSMGLTEGVAVKVIRVAPLGDPIMLEVNGYQVSLRRREAEGLTIELHQDNIPTQRNETTDGHR
jgi:Fe2+ transport system protein FeoA